MMIRPVLVAKVHLLIALCLRFNSQLRFEGMRLVSVAEEAGLSL